ncbi:hypothetical protein BKA69DRAFT_257292 [Paraphysoderma sedebokerense]|nr:hypothetical protein BKA69DRAFT_257292 [Paraphysoderma sedebokerense]
MKVPWLILAVLTTLTGTFTQTEAFIGDEEIAEYLRSFKLDNFTVPNAVGPPERKSCGFVKSAWACTAGNYCLSATKTDVCPPGFFCPPNAGQPNYCCPGFYCPSPVKIIQCPKNYYCPLGSTHPLPCHHDILAYCPPGTASPRRNGIFIITVIFGIIVLVLFSIKNKRYKRQILKDNRKLDAVIRKKDDFEVYRQHVAAQLRRRKSSMISDYSLDLSQEQGQMSIPMKKLYRSVSVKNLRSDRVSRFFGEVEDTNVEKAELPQTFDISFSKLSLTLPSGIEVLRNVTGELKSGRLTAVMGPSGSGKTTFISVLTGKVKRTGGRIWINGKEQNLDVYRKLIGFVPQDDIMLRELTVRDILLHSARMRLPKNWSDEDKTTKVLSIIDSLGLGTVMNNVIGTEEERGISGGQRKRVNIGIELVSSPSVLICDEPTSGLDSTTSSALCRLLKEIASEQKLTVAAIIHSPSAQSFEQFDDLILLGMSGRVVYTGPREFVRDYFSAIGFSVPSGVSLPDFILDVVSGNVPCQKLPNFKPSDLPEFWEKFVNGEPITAQSLYATTLALRRKPQGGHLESILSKLGIVDWIRDNYSYLKDLALEYFTFVLTIGNHDPIRETPGFFKTFILCLKRGFLQIYRSGSGFLVEQAIHLLCGGFISLAVEEYDYFGRFPDSLCKFTPVPLIPKCSEPTDYVLSAGLFITLGVLFSGVNVGVNTFGPEKLVFFRDVSSGMSTLPYMLAKFVVDIPRIVVAAAMFTMSLVLFWPYRSTVQEIFVVVLSLEFAAFTMGYFLSIIFDRSKVTLVGTAWSLVWSLVFGGAVPSLKLVNDPNSKFGSFRFLWEISAPRYAIEAIYIKEVSARPWDELLFPKDEVFNNHGYSRFNFWTDIRNVVLIGVVWLAATFLAMRLTNRQKQK